MSKYLFLLTAATLPTAVSAQSASEDALAEIIAAQDAEAAEVEEAEDPLATSPGHHAYRPVENTITVTATGLGTSVRNTGQAVTVIERDEIEAVQGADAERVLRRTPGLSVARNGSIGGFTGVNLRGANAEQLLVLVDGVRVSDPASPGGGFDFGNLLTGTVGKFDLLRGSNSTIWGSEAIGGVLDISTRGTAGLDASVEYGSRETIFAQAAGGVEGEGYFLGLTGSWFDTDGFSSAASGVERDGFEQSALGASAFVDLSPSVELFANANWSDGTLDIDGFPAPTFTLADTLETQDTQRHSGTIGLAHYGNDLTLRAAYSLADTERVNRSEDGTTTFASDGHSERVTLRGEYRLVGGLSVAFGGEHESTRFSTTFDAAAETDITGGYVQLGWVMGELAVHIGSRVDDHQLFGTNGSYGGDISYGLGNGWRLRASVGEGFKAPTLFQLLSFFGNEDLRPEESTSFDIGIERGLRGTGLHVALTAFRRNSEDLIGFDFSAARPSGFYNNIARARAQGIEAELGYDVAEGLRLSGVYSLIDTEDRTTGNTLARRPRHLATLFADYATPFGLELGADLRLVGDSFDDAGNFVRLDGFEVFDLRAAMPVTDGLRLFGRVENVFDTSYQTAAGYASPGRGAFLGIRADY